MSSRYKNYHHDSSAPTISPTTGPLQLLRGRRVMVFADDENLRCSAHNHGLKLSYASLAETLQKASRVCALHAFFSCHEGDRRRPEYFSNAGWTAHTRTIEKVRGVNGIKTLANCDNYLLFTAGTLASRSRAEVIVIASGDGDLGCDLAAAVHELPKKRVVVTMSVAGSTSRRLDANYNPNITANIELGLDVMRGQSTRRY
jgi:uncharacterized LabA/DUF88 family protein